MGLWDVLPTGQGPGIQNPTMQDEQEQHSPYGDSHKENRNLWIVFALTRGTKKAETGVKE